MQQDYVASSLNLLDRTYGKGWSSFSGVNPKNHGRYRTTVRMFHSKAIGSMIIAIVVVVIVLVAGAGYYVYYNIKSNTFSTTDTAMTTSTSSATALLLYTADAYANESMLLDSGFTSSTHIPITIAQDAGASALAALISAGDPVSVFLSVAHNTVENNSLGSEFPGWAIAFAGDQMGIAYSSATNSTGGGRQVLASYLAAEATNTTRAWYNFFDNLTSGSVKVGISNPNVDPAGFRAWMVLQLAGIEYVGNRSYFVDRMIGNNITGVSAAALVPALDTGNIQFLFIYRSDIGVSGLGLIQLANSINLGNPSYNALYSQASYTITSGTETGSAIELWLSVPKDTNNLNESVDFVVYVLQNFQTVLKNYDLVSFSPANLYNDTGYTVPAPIVSLLSSGSLVDKGSVES
jgi:molybdate/tungstate transport system substrate-binding protein